MAKLDEWLNRELIAKLLALAVAVTLWVVVVFDEQGLPKPQKAVDLVERLYSVGLTVHGVAPAFAMAPVPGAVGVRVRGSLQSLKGAGLKVRAELNLVGRQEGQTLARVVVTVPRGLEVLSVQPSSVPVTLERVVTRVFPVRVGFIGSPDSGHSVGVVSAEPATAEVEGPSSRIARIKFVMAFVEVMGANEDKTQTLGLHAVDYASATVEGVSIEPGKARVVVPIHELAVPTQVEAGAEAVVPPEPASRSDAPALSTAPDSPAPAVQPPEVPAPADPVAVAPGEVMQ